MPPLPDSASEAVPAARTVLVTGAAKRLGREIALALASAGWQVAVHYRSSEQDASKTVADCADLSRDSGTFHAKFQADLADEAAVRALLPRVVAHFGAVDAVVNSASTFENDGAESFSFASMERHWRANTGAPVLLAQALHAHLAERPDRPGTARVAGVVVNLLDQKLWNLNPDFFSYTLSKAALEAAGTMLALALAPRVRVVGVAPGLTLTSHLLDDAAFAERHRLAPLGRSSTPADVAATVKFALDNQSLTGTTLVVDGGQHLMKFDRDFSLMS
ncbi:short chain dehydrogenase [Rhodoferax koreense]|uniref:Short chain dehydrogenase n=1 Tax=Rhodoferax koreensis TaxID=1842727 RepID=A0A1P8JSF9_9BURK|nr:SDR family oxidoreductase [Rhodoferax koreense]APW36704.1 short chain dehydrogenase [Rhodoferax koreense]